MKKVQKNEDLNIIISQLSDPSWIQTYKSELGFLRKHMDNEVIDRKIYDYLKSEYYLGSLYHSNKDAKEKILNDFKIEEPI